MSSLIVGLSVLIAGRFATAIIPVRHDRALPGADGGHYHVSGL
jgi:hypothetical protein